MKSLPLKITFIYLFIGLVWIFVTDILFFKIVPPELHLNLDIYKGFFFIISTAFLLWVILFQNESKLKKMSSQFELTFHKNPIPMIILDPGNYTVLEYNQALLDLSKYNSYELKNINALELFAKDKEESESIQKISLDENEVF